jgi:hypothetical protein
MLNRKLIEGKLEALLARSSAHIATKTLTSNAPVDYVQRIRKILKEPQQLWRILKKGTKVSTTIKNPIYGTRYQYSHCRSFYRKRNPNRKISLGPRGRN